MTTNKIPITFWVISGVALLWNLMGVAAFGFDMAMTPEMLAEMPDAQRELYENNPSWLKIVYGIATVSGLLGAIGLLLKKSWSEKLFLVSLIAVIVQMGYSIFMTNAAEVMGATAGIVMPAMVTFIAVFLWYYSKKAIALGWIS